MCFLRIAGDLFGCVLIRHVEIAGAFPALEGAGELNVVFGYAQDVLDRDFSRFGWLLYPAAGAAPPKCDGGQPGKSFMRLTATLLRKAIVNLFYIGRSMLENRTGWQSREKGQ